VLVALVGVAAGAVGPDGEIRLQHVDVGVPEDRGDEFSALWIRVA
jgi:hypothetical protein